MAPFVRSTPAFALCGLSCCLCPRHRTEGPSRCPGCGGPDFAERHPTCAVATCARRHGGVEYCFQCADYPCARFKADSPVDSFISYRTVRADLAAAAADLPGHLARLARRSAILDLLLARFDEGRSKGIFCLAAALLPLEPLEEALRALDAEMTGTGDRKEVARRARAVLEGLAREAGVELKLRK